MKILKVYAPLLLALALVLGFAYQAAAKGGAALPINLMATSTDGYINDNPTSEAWQQVLPTGVIQNYMPPPGQVRVVQTIQASFIANANQSYGPYRLLIESAANGTLYAAFWLKDITDGSDHIIGGSLEVTITPGLAIQDRPTVKVIIPNDNFANLNTGATVLGSLRVRIFAQ